MSKKKRLSAIKKLILDYQIEDQVQLVTLLAEECAIETTQSIISRDLRELGVSKTIRDDKPLYDLPAIDSTQEILRRAIIDVTHNESIILVHTLGGLADFVGDFLDDQRSPLILGTLAGENILAVYPASIKKIKTSFQKICTLLDFKPKGSL